MAISVHHKVQLFAIYFITSVSGSLYNVCRYVLALVVRPRDFGYLTDEAGIQ